MLWRLAARRRVDSVDAAFVAGSLRAALLEALPANASGGMARPDEIGGQVAVLAVPHGDTLESVGLALPRGLRPDERSQLAAAVKRVKGDTFAGSLALGERVSCERLLGPATSWLTVTPYIGEGNASGMSGRRKRARRSLRYALFPGYDRRSPATGSPSWWRRSRLSDARDWPADDPLPEHLQIRFRRPVRGPLLIGRERHAGLGLMVPSGR